MQNMKQLSVVFLIGAISSVALLHCSDDDDAGTNNAAGAATGGASNGTGGASGGTGGGTTGVGGSTGMMDGGADGDMMADSSMHDHDAMSEAGDGSMMGDAMMGDATMDDAMAADGDAEISDCMKWCSGDNGVVAQCAGKLPDAVSSVEKCVAQCSVPAAEGEKGLSCWIKHLNFIVGGQSKDTHCPHTTGAAGNGQCNEIMAM